MQQNKTLGIDYVVRCQERFSPQVHSAADAAAAFSGTVQLTLLILYRLPTFSCATQLRPLACIDYPLQLHSLTALLALPLRFPSSAATFSCFFLALSTSCTTQLPLLNATLCRLSSCTVQMPPQLH